MKTIWLLPLLLAGLHAEAAINRCTDADGGVVYTDRTCAAIGTQDRLPIATPATTAFVPRELGVGCAARSPEGMRSAVYTALEQSDTNALAGLYNFEGRSSRSAASIVQRLQNLTRRRAVDIQLEYPQDDSLLGWAMPPSDELPRLRITQYVSGSEGAVRDHKFALRRAAGCVWLSG